VRKGAGASVVVEEGFGSPFAGFKAEDVGFN
jgi:hypothetical protein